MDTKNVGLSIPSIQLSNDFEAKDFQLEFYNVRTFVKYVNL
jgi:hypothetical protein